MLHLLIAAALPFVVSDIGWQVAVDRANRVESARPFQSVALSWSAPHEIAVRIRASDDGATWSEWVEVQIDGDATDSSHYRTAITHFGAPQRHLQMESSAPVDQLTATMFPPQRTRLRIAPDSLSIGHLTARSRLDWGCPDGQASALWTPAYTTVTHAVVHHTAGANSVPDWEAEVRSIWFFHTFTNGWGDIGYNYLIDPNGIIYEGRAGGSGAIGAHFSCRNTNTVGIALLGTYISGLPTDAALGSLKQLLAELSAKNRIDPVAFAYHAPTALNMPTIVGHRDGNPSALTCSKTECPGDALYSLLPAIRSDVAAIPVVAPPRRRAVRP